jgi:hypothetical protein
MKTAVQEVFSDLEKLHPNLFNVYTTEGKEFINHFHKYLVMEKEQIKNAWLNSLTKGDFNSADEYYNETFKQQKDV